MSWDSYIDNLIAQSHDASGCAHVDKVMICGLDGCAWTTDTHAKAIKATATELQNISRCFKSKDFTAFMSGGVTLEGIKYQFLREEDNSTVYAKKKGYGAITLSASKTAIVIAHCPEGGQQGNTNKAVSAIGEYLSNLGM